MIIGPTVRRRRTGFNSEEMGEETVQNCMETKEEWEGLVRGHM